MKLLEYRSVSVGEAAAALASPARAWLAALPADVAPRELAQRFPRIANELCVLWKRPSRCEVYQRDLILDQRLGRDGFPAAVIRELGALVAYYEELYPTQRPQWMELRKR
jgi:hypothetical protein